MKVSYIHPLGFVLLLLSCACTAATPAQDEQQPDSMAGAGFDWERPFTPVPRLPEPPSRIGGSGSLLLKGSVQHSESMSPVETDLREGCTFNVSSLPSPAPGNNWHWIPAWRAGRWRRENSTRYYAEDLLTHRCSYDRLTYITRAEADSGFLRDREGDIWEYEHAPYVGDVDGGNYVEVEYIRSRVPVELKPDRVVYRFQSTNLAIQKGTKKILEVQQTESLQTYRPAGKGFIRCETSVKTFDQLGTAIRLDKIVSEFVLVRPFSPWYRYNGKDMMALFRQFLTSRGMAELAPVPPGLVASGAGRLTLGRHPGAHAGR